MTVLPTLRYHKRDRINEEPLFSNKVYVYKCTCILELNATPLQRTHFVFHLYHFVSN